MKNIMCREKAAMGRYRDAFNRMDFALEDICIKYNTGKIHFYVDALWCYIRYGVTPNEYISFQFYRYNHFERKTFFTARHAAKYEEKLNDRANYHVFWDKEKTNEVFREFIKRDYLYVQTAQDEEIKNFITKHKSILLKPNNASSGKGIRLYTGQTISQLREENLLLEEYVVQHEKMAKLNPSSVNTVRIYTILDDTQIPHILSASIRVGGINSVVDNYHSGGVGYPLDIKTGVVCGPGSNLTSANFLYHPGNNVKVIGFEVPQWDKIIEFVNRLCLVIPTARFIAWDIAILQDGLELIEANYDGDPGFMQSPLKQGKLIEIRKWTRT